MDRTDMLVVAGFALVFGGVGAVAISAVQKSADKKWDERQRRYQEDEALLQELMINPTDATRQAALHRILR